MVTRKRGLGRGLDALLGQSESAVRPVDEESQLRELPVEYLKPGRYQPRKEMDSESLRELADSIKVQGVMQPIIVRPVTKDSYEIIAGERRWRASQLAGLDKVPVIIRIVDDHAAIAMSLIENIQREDLNPMEEARALRRLAEEFELTHQQVAEAVGKNRATVTNYLRLNELVADVARLLEVGELDMGHARALLPLAAEDQRAVAQTIVKGHMTVRQAEALVRKVVGRTDQAKVKTKVGQDRDVERLASRLSDQLGQPVSIRQGARGKGQLVISYHNLDELDGLLDRLGVPLEGERNEF